MKRANRIILVITVLLISIFFVSCAPVTTSQTSTVTAASSTSGISAMVNELAELKKANERLSSNISMLETENKSLKQKLDDASHEYLLENNYTIDGLLRKITTEKSKVDIFPGVLKSIRVESKSDRTYFVLTIDRMEINPDWKGPIAGGIGYYVNGNVKFEEFIGDRNTNFEYTGYKTYAEKEAAVIAQYGKGNVYEFFMIGDEIVCVFPDPGP